MLIKTKIRLVSTTLSVALLTMTIATPGIAATALTPQDVKKIVHDYLQEHPEEIVATVQRMQQEKEKKRQQEVADNVKKYKEELVNKAGDIVAGNPEGDVTLVEFFDYNCGYCKKAAPEVAQAIKDDGNLRVVFKEYPILSPESQIAARTAAALFAVDSRQYLTFHMELMKQNGPKNSESLLALVGKLGVDVEKVKRATTDGSADKLIGENLVLAQNIGLQGTPAFIVGDELIPGAVDAATLKAKIAAVRSKVK